ncbi:MAG TPA: hypothetical protein VG722_10490 [Tepidisphaeraceae bacterium]|nr:hypothetical protein [Tepidisphaeraceae bacterium]
MLNNRRSLTAALWINALLLAIIALSLITRGRDISLNAPAFGQFQSPIAGGAGVFIMPGQFSRDTYGCYLMDVDTQTLCVYSWDAADRKLKLLAARSFRYDRQLTDYNTENPSPAEVRELIQRESAGLSGPRTQP